MKRRLILLIAPILLLTGCWDLKQLSQITYVSALGVDYVNNEFVIYVQVLDFATIGKSEQASSGAEGPNIWIGKGKGTTFAMAWNDLYNSTQQRTIFGQISSIVFKESALGKKHVKESLDTFERFVDARLTPWIYTTKEPIDKIFAVEPMLPNSPIMTLLHLPNGNYEQHSLISPMKLVEFASLINEPSASIIIPTLGLNDQLWKKDDKNMPMMNVNGAFLFYKAKKPQWLSKDDLKGLRWVDRNTERTPLSLNKKNPKIKALLPIEDPIIKIHSKVNKSGVPKFNMNIKVHATVTQLNAKVSNKVLQNEAEKEIKKEIRTTFSKGISKKLDVFHLEEEMFRNNYKSWKLMTKKNEFPLTSKSLGSIKVKVTVTDREEIE
ncbi:Ger(x)C family spore germination protein [Bacillus sp. EAC]|uniref:Ger(x)C family spore germination protein n=1 Tax=Bacillus sp. EAC TaxID=1978338 RepID=UPI000B4476D6|nr:Ger(x)C family spore germination protein [Bacillus sp. EAC]